MTLAAAWEIVDKPRHRAWFAAVILILASPLLLRGLASTYKTPHAMADIYRQQIQMAEFFRTYYPNAPIAINDIGAISFYGDPHITDIYGLGSTRITRIRTKDPNKAGNITPGVLSILKKNNVEVAAVYDSWYGLREGNIPPDWIKVGAWRVPELTSLGSDTVSFYGMGKENAARLQTNLAEFHAKLPPELQSYAVP
jgi:hypothetical protein